MVGDMVSPCPLHSSKVPCVWLPFPAISQSSRGQLYGWLPLSNAYGISSVAAQHKIKRITAFLPLRHNT